LIPSGLSILLDLSILSIPSGLSIRSVRCRPSVLLDR
jgi:hypothetical protein